MLYSCYILGNCGIYFLTLASNLRKRMLHFLANDMRKQLSLAVYLTFKKNTRKRHFTFLPLSTVFNIQLS